MTVKRNAYVARRNDETRGVARMKTLSGNFEGERLRAHLGHGPALVDRDDRAVEDHDGTFGPAHRRFDRAEHFVQGARRDDLPVLHRDHAVCETHHFFGRVRHVENRHREFVAQALEPRKNLLLALPVEGRERFIHQENLGRHRDRARNGAALPLAAGEFRYATLQKVTDAEKLHGFGEFFASARVLRALETETEVFLHVQVRKKTRLLKDVSQRAAVRRKKDSLFVVLPRFAGDDDPAFGMFEPRDAAQKRGLPAARRSEENGDALCRKRGVGLEGKARRTGEANRYAVLHRPLLAAPCRSKYVRERRTKKLKTSMPPASQWALSYSIPST